MRPRGSKWLNPLAQARKQNLDIDAGTRPAGTEVLEEGASVTFDISLWEEWQERGKWMGVDFEPVDLGGVACWLDFSDQKSASIF